MSSLYESYNYDVSYRAIVNSNNVVKVFTERDYIEVNSQISFDIEDSSNTSFNYFTSSIISGIIHNLIFVSKKSNIKLEDIEGKIKIKLKNPLTVLAVNGYTEEAKIDSCEITIYLFSDLDGTLLNNNGELSDYTKKIIGECNIPLTLVSARSPQKMESILNDLGVGGIHIAFNGAMVFKKENNKFIILNKEILDREFSRKLVLDIRSKFPKIGISLYDTDNWNVDLVNKVIEREKKVVKVNYSLVDFNQYFNEILKEIYKVSFIEDDIEVFRKLVNYVEVNYSDEKITIQKSLSGYLEITHTNAKKSLGIEYVMNLKNIDRDSTVAFGDGENDISMLKSAGYSIVMGNATDKVKEHADFITKSNNEDGVAYVIEKIINNQDLK